MTRRLVGFGHSHLSTIMKAWRQGEKQGDFEGLDATFVRLNAKTFQPNFETLTADEGPRDNRTFSKKLLDRLQGRAQHEFGDAARIRVLHQDLERRMKHVLARSEADAILLACMGNEYNTMGLLRHPRPYDFDLPGSGLPVEEGVELIPYPMMKAQIQLMAERNVLLFWRYFNKIASVPIYLVPPPPPIGSEEHILSYPGNFADRAKTYGVSPVPFRCKLWMLYCQVIREAVAEGAGTTFVELPPVVFSEGTLARQFWNEDPTHGNVDYGRVILDHVLELAFGELAEA